MDHILSHSFLAFAGEFHHHLFRFLGQTGLFARSVFPVSSGVRPRPKGLWQAFSMTKFPSASTKDFCSFCKSETCRELLWSAQMHAAHLGEKHIDCSKGRVSDAGQENATNKNFDCYFYIKINPIRRDTNTSTQSVYRSSGLLLELPLLYSSFLATFRKSAVTNSLHSLEDLKESFPQ